MSSNPDPTGDRRSVLPSRRDAGTPPPSTPPKSYSVGEMMSTLRSPEGSKRRRRSVQPVHTSRRRRRIWLTVGISVASLALATYFGFRFFQKIRLEGETFRDGVNRRISEALGCQVEINRIFDGGDKSLAATEARFDTRDSEDLLQSGKFANLSASLTPSSWVTDQWGILVLSLTEGTLTFDPDRPAIPLDNTKVVPHTRNQERSGEGSWRFGINPEPNRISIDKIQVSKGLNIEWPSKAGEVSEGLRKLRGNVKFPRSGELSGGMEGSFNDGVITLREMPEMRLESLHWTLQERKLDVQGARISFGGKASVSLSGHADLVKDGSMELNADFASMPLTSILPRVWHEAVLGMFAAEKTTFRASFGKGPERVFEGDFTVTGIIFDGFLFFNKVAGALDRPELSRPEFPVLSGHFKWSPSTGLELTQLSGAKEGLLRLNGSVTVSPIGTVKGQLKVSSTLMALRGANQYAPKIFTTVEGDWTSLEFNVSGEGKSLVDDIPVPVRTATGILIVPNQGTPAPAAPSQPSPQPQTPPSETRPSPAPPPRSAPPVAPQAPKPSNAELEKQMEDLLRANKAAPR